MTIDKTNKTHNDMPCEAKNNKNGGKEEEQLSDRKLKKLAGLVPSEKICFIQESKHHYFILTCPKEEEPNSWNSKHWCVYKDYSYLKEFSPIFDCMKDEYDDSDLIYINSEAILIRDGLGHIIGKNHWRTKERKKKILEQYENALDIEPFPRRVVMPCSTKKN